MVDARLFFGGSGGQVLPKSGNEVEEKSPGTSKVKKNFVFPIRIQMFSKCFLNAESLSKEIDLMSWMEYKTKTIAQRMVPWKQDRLPSYFLSLCWAYLGQFTPRGSGGGLAVRVLAFYSGDSSLNPAGYLKFLCTKIKNKQRRFRGWPIFQKAC